MLLARLPAYCIAVSVLAGCLSLGSLESQTPQVQREVSGDYFTIAECTKARQSAMLPPGSRLDLLHDRARGEATVTWSTDIGAYQAYAFKAGANGHTTLKVYSTTAVPEDRLLIVQQCSAS
ncbi:MULTISPECIES: hypothetical protein [unclassified Cupriavidus]|uniref:hypothetical protein n=1 Tax=unclassified Cupriavidus TaxID=2640874 RepID=UPI00313F0297